MLNQFIHKDECPFEHPDQYNMLTLILIVDLTGDSLDFRKYSRLVYVCLEGQVANLDYGWNSFGQKRIGFIMTPICFGMLYKISKGFFCNQSEIRNPSRSKGEYF